MASIKRELRLTQNRTTAAGFKAKVPTEVDLLIVGSSCVDFSSLNPKKKKKLSESRFFPGDDVVVDPANPAFTFENFANDVEDLVGESAVTFFSSMKHILKVRPKLVLLENVNTAPWKNIADQYFPMAQYHARYVSVDSKEFGVPQTRLRGYCVAADWTHYSDDAAKIVEGWAKIVQAIAPRTQIPLEKLLLHPGDRAVREMEIPIERGSCREPSAKATMCNMRHRDAREQFFLPDLNPMTGLDERGTCKPDDRVFGGWIQKQGGRVCDLLDISWLRILYQLNFDARFKLHIIDLSQNVDRSLGQVGQSPCVTPNGIQFLTAQGRPLMGSEAFALQGIDSSKLVPSTESEKEWRDLAGNAMTTTVIGSAILAAIVSEFNVCKNSEKGLKDHSRDVINDFRGEGREDFDDKDMVKISDGYDENLFGVIVAELLDLYKQSRSYCPCDGLGIRNRANHLSICNDCGEIRCKFCAGNPQHNFRPFSINFNLNSRAETTQLLCSLFPPKFTLTTEGGEDGLLVPEIKLFDFDSRRVSDIAEKAFQVCCESVTYYYDGCHVGQNLTVFYTSKRSFAHVVISDTAVTWTIYMDIQKCRKVLPGEATRVPCVRAVMDKTGFSHIPSKNDWLLWVDDKHQVEVEINESLNRMVRIKYDILSIKNKEGFEDVDPRVSTIVRGALQEEYELTERCGTSHGILYFSRAQRLYHILQPHPSEPGKNDRFVIAGTNRALESFEDREPILIFPPNFRPIASRWERVRGNIVLQKGQSGDGNNDDGGAEDLKAKKGKGPEKGAKGKKEPTISAELEEPKTLICEFPGIWVKVSSGTDTDMRDANSPPSIAPNDRLLSSSEPLETAKHNRCDVSARWLHVEVPLKDISWKNETHQILWKPYFGAPIDDDGDSLMVPQPVEYRVFEVSIHNHDDLLSTFAFAFNLLSSKVGGQVKIQPIELPQDLCSRCVPETPTIHRLRGGKNRVVAVVEDVKDCETFERSINERPAPLKVFAGIDCGATKMNLHLEVNLATLCHRASGHLSREGTRMGVRRDLDLIVGGAEIVTGFTDSPGRLDPFETSLQSLPSGGVEGLELPSFSRNGNSLRPDQVDCVRWMIARETEPKPFIEKEVEEHYEKHIGLRLSGWAQIKNDARGGILAQEVGFGKTVVSLALVDHQRGLVGRSMEERREWCGEGLRHAKASLFIVPHHIVGQWESEVKKFLGSDPA